MPKQPLQMTIPDLLEDAVAEGPSRPFIVTAEGTVTYELFQQRSSSLTSGFRDLGIQRGDHVAVMLRNSPEFLVVWLALARIGAALVPINTAYLHEEVGYLLDHSEAKACVAAPEFQDMVQRAEPRWGGMMIGTNEGGSVTLAQLEESHHDWIEAGLCPDDTAAIVYTSGTTARPKGVVLSHRTYVLAGQAFPAWMRLSEDDRLLLSLPLYHINAQAYTTMGAIACGASVVPVPRFSSSGFWAMTRAFGVTEFNAVGAMLTVLFKQPPRADDADNPVRICYTALAMAREEHEAFERRFGLRLEVGYGMTESAFGTITSVVPEQRYGSIGLPRRHPDPQAHSEIAVVDRRGQPVQPGVVGEIVMRGPALFQGYYRDPSRTAAAVRDGWLHSGDSARMDTDGYYFFVDRQADMIRRRGENISSLEVEETIGRHPKVLECAVIGIPSPLGEQDVAAYVVALDNESVSPQDIIYWCAGRLAAYKTPSLVEVRSSLPKTPTNRIAKHLLRAEREKKDLRTDD